MSDYYSETSVGLAGGPASQFASEKARPQMRLRNQGGALPDVSGTITVQGEVTGNFRVDRSLPRIRSKNSERSAELAPMEIFGGNMDDLHIKQHDFVFAQKNPNRMTLRGRHTPPKTSTTFAMASMTGISTKHRDVYNQEDWEDLFWVPGRAKSDWSYGDSSQSDTGVAVQLRGSMTIRNNGTTTFTIGDYVAWRTYSINPEARREEKRRFRKALGEPNGKLGVILRRVTFEDIYRLPATALSRYIKNVSGTGERSSFLRIGYKQALGDSRLESKERFFLNSMRAESTVGFFLNLSVAVQYGLVSINLSGNSATDEDLLKSVRNVKFSDLEKADYEISAENTLEKSGDADLRSSRWKKFTLLARAYGCFTDGGKPVPHLDNVVDAGIRRTTAGLMDRPDSFAHAKAAMISKMARKPGSVLMPGSMSTAHSDEVKLDNLQRDYAPFKYQSYSEAEHHGRKNILGICTRGAEAGEQMDMLI
jgi:hypothetical protein